jgi:hypothetical protein
MASIRNIYITALFYFIVGSIHAQVINVNSAAQLQAALNTALPGQTIQIQDGYYERSGGFYANAGIDGTEANPIIVIGSRNVVLSTNNLTSGYAFSLKGNKYWIIKGFTVVNSKNGVVLDSCKYVTVDSIQAKKLGQDGIHLRTYTSYCTVKRCYIDSTGLNDYSFGEGIYIGSAYSNWCTYTDCNPDTSNYNQILFNSFGSFVTAENIDVKEGTKGGLIKGNNFNGLGLQGMNGGDSWIDMKGNYYTVENNTGNHSILDGIQTHIQQPGGYGNYNTFSNNVLNVNGPGYGIRVQTSNANGTAAANVVCTNNQASGAVMGLTNVAVVNCSNALPVTLLNWNASVANHKLNFTWGVATVTGIEGFIIEHSPDSRSYTKFLDVNVAGVRYNTQVDQSPGTGKFFRLKVVLHDGSFFYSKEINLTDKSAGYQMKIEGNRLFLFYPGNDGRLAVYSQVGQRLRTFKLSGGANYLDLPFQNRTYLLNVLNDQRLSYSYVIIK